MKATIGKKRDRKFNNNKFSFKMRQKTYLKAQKMFEISQTCSLHERVLELIGNAKAKA